MKTARAHRKFAIYSGFLDTVLEGEEEVAPGETRKDTLKKILKELEETAAELRKEAESMRGQIIHETIQGARKGFPPIGPSMPEIIDYKKTENLEAAIERAETIDELKDVKTVYPLMPAKIIDMYNKKMEQLLTGRPVNFTENLD